jgi:hypothetical protein
MTEKLGLSFMSFLSLICLFGCSSVIDGLDVVGNKVLMDDYYDGYYDFSIDDSSKNPILSFRVVDDLPYDDSEFDLFLNSAMDEAETMIYDYYTGPAEGVIYIEQHYNNGYCSSRYNFDEGYVSTVCQRDGLFD